jgi:hypothetical protein
VQVIDASDPSNPAIIATVPLPESAWSVAVRDRYLYVGDYDTQNADPRLYVVDVVDPSSPIILGSAAIPSQAYGLAVGQGALYLATGSAGLQVVDITNPSAPRLLGGRNTPGSARGVTVDGDFAYIADMGSGLGVTPVQCNPGSDAPESCAPPGRLQLRVAPNPCRGPVRIRIDGMTGDALTRLTIHDFTGRLIRSGIDAGAGGKGERFVMWNGRDNAGHPAAPGMYVVRLTAGDAATSQILTVIR